MAIVHERHPVKDSPAVYNFAAAVGPIPADEKARWKETVDVGSRLSEVRVAAHRFMEEYQNVGLMRRDLVNGKVKILESYVAPAAFEFEIDDTQLKKGTWLLAVRVVNNELWKQIKAGELTGFSIGGSALRS